MKLGNLQVSFTHIDNKTTVCTVATVGRISTGIAVKGPNDLFSKSEGNKHALARALKHMNLTKDQRTKVWNDWRDLPKNPRW